MNLKPAYEYLNKPHRIELRIRRLMYRREALLSCLLPKGLKPKIVQVQESAPGDKMADVMAEVKGIEDEVERLSWEKVEAIQDTIRTISRLESDAERTVLMGFYVARRPMTELAEELHYSERSAFRLKRKALENITRLIA